MESEATVARPLEAVRAGAPVLALCGVLLVATGGIELLAAWIRWTPCLAEFDTIECALAEDHSRDYAIVSEPFVAIPLAVPLAGAASLLLLAFWSIVAAAPWAGRWARVMAAVTAATLVVVGGGQLIASMSDGQLGVLGALPANITFAILLAAPTLAAVLLALRSSETVAERVAWLTVAVSVLLGNPVSDLVLLNSFSGSHDTPVGGGAPHAVLTALAGVVLLLASAVVAARRGPRPAEPPVDRE